MVNFSFQKKYLSIYFLLKIFFSFLSFFVVSSYTKIGDSDRYIGAGLNFGISILVDSTAFMDSIGGLLGMAGPLVSYVCFSSINFLLLCYAIYGLPLTRRNFIILLVFFSTPNFLLWTSVPSKEVFVSGAMAIIASQIVRIYFSFATLSKAMVLISFYIVVVFKPHFIPAVFVAYFSAWFFGTKNGGRISFLLLTVIGFLSIFFILYSLNDFIGETVFRVIRGFDLNAGASREEFWINPSDWYMKSPQGMLLSFWGPTLSEAYRSPFVFMCFVESFVISIVVVYLLIKIFFNVINSGRFRLSYMSIILFSFSFLLFATYPFGVMNYGSAIRYKQGYYPFVVLILFMFSLFNSKSNYSVVKR